MTADEEIEQLDTLLGRLHKEHPNKDAILRINPTTFGACTKQHWQKHNWTISDEKVASIRSRDAQKKREALEWFLKPHHIRHVEIVAGADKIEVEAIPD